RGSRLSRGEADGGEPGEALEQRVQSTVASRQAPALARPSRPRAAPGRAPADAGPARDWS
ncbi:hypothetical protein ABTP72_19565, partial [Acinetobacter baumannii]